MPATATQVAIVAAWVDQFSNASEALKEKTAAVAEAAWMAFDDWYDPVKVDTLAADMASLSGARQQTIAGTSAQYIAQVTAALAGTRVNTAPLSPWLPIRNGVDLKLVHMRPANAYKHAIAMGYTHQQALNLAGRRAMDTLTSDLTLEERAASQRMLDSLGIVTFRRILHPELSRTGSCGLCVAAADRKYSVGDLMPLHPPTCKCTVMPVIGDVDPGIDLNEADLAKLYGDAGSTAAADLRRTRYAVHEHGELGPTLAKAGDSFRGPGRVALENDPERAKRMLDQALPVLSEMIQRDEAGDVKPEQLAYQQGYVAKLQGIVSAAA